MIRHYYPAMPCWSSSQCNVMYLQREANVSCVDDVLATGWAESGRADGRTATIAKYHNNFMIINILLAEKLN